VGSSFSPNPTLNLRENPAVSYIVDSDLPGFKNLADLKKEFIIISDEKILY